MPPQAAQLPLLVVQGHWAEARDLASVTRDRGSPLERQMAVMALGNLAWYQGNTEQAWAMVRELVPRGPGSEPEDSLFPYAIEMLRLAVGLALDASDAAGARAWLLAYDRWLDWSGAVRGRVESQLLWARLHQTEGDLPRAERCIQDALALASNPRQPLSLLAAHRASGRLAMGSRRHADAEKLFTQALALSEACATPYERACTLADVGELCLATGRADEARVHLDEALATARELGAAPLIARLDLLQSRRGPRPKASDLTARELDVLRLVADGMTDVDVAERLSISPRTVGQHLRSVYNKLGVSSRTAATRIAIKDELV